ncbi:hypothetical protein [Flavobacterium sp.]|uniref:hypothetical protein n=1 Tax=Flavobacterium sp. TaxID=239 RepID=UPI0031D494C4
MKKLSIIILLLILSTVKAQTSKVEQPITFPLSFTEIINTSKSNPNQNILVFEQPFDASNYKVYGGTPIGLKTILEKTWKILDSTKQKITAPEKIAIQSKIQKDALQKFPEQTDITFVTLKSYQHQNLGSNVVPNADTSEDVLDALISRRVDIIRANTPLQEQEIYQFTKPLYFNKNTNALVLYLIAKPGKYEFYVNLYSFVNKKWEKKDSYLLTADRN